MDGVRQWDSDKEEQNDIYVYAIVEPIISLCTKPMVKLLCKTDLIN